ncbi:MAG TPA: glycosyltransferase family 2 protein [Xanthomonadales bacterium]|nr:glycosyltransferase family 2 protein [Xanthomonadales bacterium]
MLDQITPVVLTWNEAANIGRTLAALSWANRVVVLDSGSNDETERIARSHPNVDWHVRPFDDHATQSNFALDNLLGGAPWTMFLDADHVLTPELVAEIASATPPVPTSGYYGRFRYCVEGRPLRGTLYPPRVVLFRPERGRFEQEGHAHWLRLRGSIGELRGWALHDDRKPRADFVATQRKYARMEARWLASQPFGSLSRADRARRLLVVAPWAAPLFALFLRGVVLDGFAGWRYAAERALAESFIARELLALYFRKNRTA